MSADVASSLNSWSTTESSNSPSGSTPISTNLDDNLRMIQAVTRFLAAKGSDIASATTTNLSTATGNFVDITGTTTITGLGTLTAGMWFILRFNGALTFTHNATSLILPGGANITTASGDIAHVVSLGFGNWLCTNYVRASSAPIAYPVTVAQGGTGATTLTANNVVLGNGTSAVQFVAPGTSGNVLTSNGTTWTSSTGVPSAASQSDMAAASSTSVYVTPGRVKYSPNVAKAVVKCDIAGNINYSVGVSSITDGGTGRLRVTWSTAFTSVDYVVNVSIRSQTCQAVMIDNSSVNAQTTTSAEFLVVGTTNSAEDPVNYFVSAWGVV